MQKSEVQAATMFKYDRAARFAAEIGRSSNFGAHLTGECAGSKKSHTRDGSRRNQQSQDTNYRVRRNAYSVEVLWTKD